jgi:hypothetical protein
MAGFIAYATDACGDGCCKCSAESDALAIWRMSVVVTTSDAAMSDMRNAQLVDRISVTGGYERALDAGNYLVCDADSCVGFAVGATGVVTVNVQKVYGPSQIIAFAPDGTSLAANVFAAVGILSTQ